jgi:hypothetical protein
LAALSSLNQRFRSAMPSPHFRPFPAARAGGLVNDYTMNSPRKQARRAEKSLESVFFLNKSYFFQNENRRMNRRPMDL